MIPTHCSSWLSWQHSSVPLLSALAELSRNCLSSDLVFSVVPLSWNTSVEENSYSIACIKGEYLYKVTGSNREREAREVEMQARFTFLRVPDGSQMPKCIFPCECFTTQRDDGHQLEPNAWYLQPEHRVPLANEFCHLQFGNVHTTAHIHMRLTSRDVAVGSLLIYD
jgi:hypothetical protein